MQSPLRTRIWVAALIACGVATVPRAAAQSPAGTAEGSLLWLDALDPAQIAPVSEVGLVLVEAVVTDAKGRPVTGLTVDAFDLREDGLSRAVDSFRPVDLTPPDAAGALQRTPPRVSENVPRRRVEPVRTFVVVLDTAHLGPASLPRARSIATRFLTEHTRPGDRVVLVAPEERLVRSARMPDGREALLEIVEALPARRDDAPRLSDLEAYLIAERRDRAAEERVRDRLAGSGAMTPRPLEAEARAVLGRARERRGRLLTALTSVLEVLTTERIRKSVLLVSEGFLYEPGDRLAYGLIAATQRADAAIEFLDARGPESVRAGSGATARLGPATGAELLCSVTGGMVVRDTDPAAALARISETASHHYVLGYLPSLDRQGQRLRRISVAVDRPDVEVQARRAYWYTPRGIGRGSGAASLEEALGWALASAPLLEDIPLRLTALPLGATGDGLVEVALASEASLAALSLEESPDGTRIGELEVVLEVRHVRPGARRVADPETLPVRVPADTPLERTWVPFRQRMALPPGLSQIKAVVRDRRSGAIGTVAHPLEIPEPSALRASAPILSDLSSGEEAEPPHVVARRDFPQGSVLYCYFEVFPGPDGRSLAPPEGTSSFAVIDRRGKTRLRGALPLPERSDDGLRRHLLEIPLARMEPGEYELVLDLAGDLPGGPTEVRESFRVARPPAFDDALYLGALAAFDQGDFERAMTSLLQWPPGEVRDAARRLPRGEDGLRRMALLLHTELAMLLRRHGIGDRAEKHLEIARDLVADEAHAELRHSWLLAAAFEYQQRELPAQALALYTECARAFPERGEARLGAGTLQERYAFLPEGFGRSNLSLAPRRAAQAAERSYREALRLQPELTEARLRLGRVLQLTQRPDEAVEQLEKVFGSGEGGPVVGLSHLFRGEIAEARGRTGAAIEHYRVALEAAPDLQVAALALAQLLHRRHGRQAAARVLVPALATEWASPWLTYRRGPLRLSVPPLQEIHASAGTPFVTPQ